MTFTQALQKLAEREPGKFKWFEAEDELSWAFGFHGCAYEENDFTQDAIDEILAMVTGDDDLISGWEYSVRKNYDGNWEWLIWPYAPSKAHRHAIMDENESGYPTKLEAARQALIAVVEHLEGK